MPSIRAFTLELVPAICAHNNPATTTMAGMMVPMIRFVSPLILEAYHGQTGVHH